MEITRHFKKENGDILEFTLIEDEFENLLKILPRKFLDLYTTEEMIKKQTEVLKESRQQVISNFLPTRGSIKSGEFGEMIAGVLLAEHYGLDEYFFPPKWRWKQEPDKAAPRSDVIILKRIKHNPGKDDLLISAECKAKATKNNEYRPIQKAIEGAQTNSATRIISTLKWLEYQYKKTANEIGINGDELREKIKLIRRYRYPVENGEYEREVKAVAILEKDFAETEMDAGYEISSDYNIDLIIISIKNLKTTYESVYEGIKQC